MRQLMSGQLTSCDGPGCIFVVRYAPRHEDTATTARFDVKLISHLAGHIVEEVKGITIEEVGPWLEDRADY